MKKISSLPLWNVVCMKFANDTNDLFVLECNGSISKFSFEKKSIVWISEGLPFFDVTSISVSPNNSMVIGGGSKNCLFVINAANGKPICSIDVGSTVWCVLFLSQQKIACGLSNGTVAIVCWQTQKIEKILKFCECHVRALAISPLNNDNLLTGDNNGVIKQTIISSEKTVMVYEGHTGAVKDLSFLSCGNMFVSASYDHTARLFALDQKQAIRVFKGKGHTNWIMSVSLIHDDEFLITSSWDKTVKVWKVESGECLSTVKAEQDVWCGDVSKDEKSFYVGAFGGKVTLFSCPPRSAVSLDRTLRLDK